MPAALPVRLARRWPDWMSLDAYSASGVPLHYAPSAVIASSIDRLRALAEWTTRHARTNGVLALVQHANMYLAHARWLAMKLRAG
jgi:hypothetical protein